MEHKKKLQNQHARGFQHQHDMKALLQNNLRFMYHHLVEVAF